jgi:serine/threonine-protein kinase RsbW
MRVLSQIKLPAKIDHFQAFMDFVSSCAGKQGFSRKRISEIELATEEALINIFNYAYEGKGGDAEIVCKLDNNKFILEIVDSGVPFDVLSVENPDITADISRREVGGLGVFLMKKLVDGIQYRYDGDRNILSLIILKEEPIASH